MTDDAHKTLAQAFIAAQHEMPAVAKEGTNPAFKGAKFMTLGALVAKVRPILNKHGLAFAQFPAQDDNGKPTLVTVLIHTSGERMEYATPLILAKNDPQGLGSAITYMRRYALAAALGIVDQEDDDGNAASKTSSSVPTVPPRTTPSASGQPSIVVGAAARKTSPSPDEYASKLIALIDEAGILEYVRPKLADLGVKPGKQADLRSTLMRLEAEPLRAFTQWVNEELVAAKAAA